MKHADFAGGRRDILLIMVFTYSFMHFFIDLVRVCANVWDIERTSFNI